MNNSVKLETNPRKGFLVNGEKDVDKSTLLCFKKDKKWKKNLYERCVFSFIIYTL